MKEIKRRDFLRYAGVGLATIVVGCGGGGGGGGVPPAGGGNGGGGGDDGGGGGGGGGLPPIVETLNFTITDIVKEMVTHNPGGAFPNPAECYYWVFKEDRFPADNPAPQIFAFAGDRIALNVTNALDGPHAFVIPGRRPGDNPMVDTGPIAPGETVSVEFEAKEAGTYLYHDNLNAPVNRVMGLHGAFVVMPREAASGHKLTPYHDPSPAVQQLYDDFGTAPWWPGLSWEAGDTATNTAPARQVIWLTHQASPVLFDEVGTFARNNPGQDYPAAQFVEAFTNDPFVNVSNDPRSIVNAQFPVKTTQFNRLPHFFTINGLSGFFAHHNPAITPFNRVGEPTLVRILNAGLWTHSMHMHANHFFITGINNESQENPIWVDVFNIYPMDRVDYTIPYMRPPDIPNQRGIGRADAGLGSCYPPLQEFALHNPRLGTLVTNFAGTGTVDLAVQQSPLCYPMHDHSEPSQTAQGGNYNCGLIAGIYFLGDRNTPGFMDFEREADFDMMKGFGDRSGVTGPPTGGWPAEDVVPV